MAHPAAARVRTARRLGGHATRHGGGYTLVEVLTVLVVLGLAASVVALSLTLHPRASLESEARRLALLLEYARDEAVATGHEILWTPHEKGYAFVRRMWGTGRTVYQERIPDWTRRWPPEVSLGRLEIGARIVLKGGVLSFSPTGINAPYTVVLMSGLWRVSLAGDVLGGVRILDSDPREASLP